MVHRRRLLFLDALGRFLAFGGIAGFGEGRGRRGGFRRGAGMTVVMLELGAVLMAFDAGAAHHVDVHHVVHAHLPFPHAHVEHRLIEAVVNGGVVAHRLLDAPLFELQVGIAVEHRAILLRPGDPLVEARLVHTVEFEAHMREAVTAIVG
ncbi:hypothetical protein D9M72_493610 [compost metagenome]